MHKVVELWPVREFQDLFGLVHFPEYQREPNLWSLSEKERLIDSMARQFDIASLYFYEHSDGVIDCVDGRQRIGAIMSFLGKNEGDMHNGFGYRVHNEITDESSYPFSLIEHRTFSEMNGQRETNPCAREFVDRILSYKLAIVLLSDCDTPAEFNLQFTRLNLGVIINSGEKLNAMVGDLRDVCFDEEGLSRHPFLRSSGIPIRRFAHEQLVAQILAQILSFENSGSYTRTRHFDLQKLFKEFSWLPQEYRESIDRTSELFDFLHEAFDSPERLRSRAMVVSIVLFAWELKVESAKDGKAIVQFVMEFLRRVRWQVNLGVRADEEYYHLLEFQRHITQASVERSAVNRRSVMLKEEYEYWGRFGRLRVTRLGSVVTGGVIPRRCRRRHCRMGIDPCGDSLGGKKA